MSNPGARASRPHELDDKADGTPAHRIADGTPAHQIADGTSAHRGWHSRGYQPHCDYPGLVQSIGSRLFDSVPAHVIDRWTRELAQRCAGVPPANPKTSGVSPAKAADKQRRKQLCAQIDRYADMGYGSCYLADTRIAELTENALLYFDNQRYDLLAWCVMSNHIHVLAVPKPRHSLSDILQSWKSYTAHAANKILRREGQFWFPDYFDEFMRTTSQMEATILYIEFNPVTARLVSSPEQWKYSSAAPHHRDRVVRNRLMYPEIDPENLPDF